MKNVTFLWPCCVLLSFSGPYMIPIIEPRNETWILCKIKNLVAWTKTMPAWYATIKGDLLSQVYMILEVGWRRLYAATTQLYLSWWPIIFQMTIFGMDSGIIKWIMQRSEKALFISVPALNIYLLPLPIKSPIKSSTLSGTVSPPFCQISYY